MKAIIAATVMFCAFCAPASAADAGLTRVTLQVGGADGAQGTYELHVRDGMVTPLVSATVHKYVKACQIGDDGAPKLEWDEFQTGLVATVNVEPSSADGAKVVALSLDSARLIKRSELASEDGCHIDLFEVATSRSQSHISLKQGGSENIMYGPNGSDRVTVAIE